MGVFTDHSLIIFQFNAFISEERLSFCGELESYLRELRDTFLKHVATRVTVVALYSTVLMVREVKDLYRIFIILFEVQRNKVNLAV